ncbi:hypothetical protein OCH239_10985 [Roseivivax halodurans JCM 10272]|uniref:Uncharacterized protein n=1 Tax=Roseivivax halodurans JCM 10272 TaxID=1449350 RepID=X7EBX7_9RHOB|nr:hypothetical protein OCH239_10985 [Roseivivax halodurans JCM 10272]
MNQNLEAKASVSLINSTAEFFDDTQYGIDIAWRF